MLAARRSRPCKVVVAGAEDKQILKALRQAEELGLVNPVLVGDKTLIRECCAKILLEDWPIIDAPSEETALRAIQVVNENPGSLLMKGSVSTARLMKAVLNRKSGIRGEKLLSHVAAVETPGYDKLLYITDGAMNLNPDIDDLEIITRNAIDFLKVLGIAQPNTALAALIEDVNPKIDATLVAAQLAARFSGNEKVEGPLSLDIALSAAAAEKKDFKSEIAGKTDILVMPDAMTCNVAVKILRLVGNGKIGGVVVGAKVPILLVSRSDDASSNLQSIILGIVYQDNLRRAS